MCLFPHKPDILRVQTYCMFDGFLNDQVNQECYTFKVWEILVQAHPGGQALVKHGTAIVDYWSGFGFFSQFTGECQEVEEFVLAAAIKLLPAVAVVTI